ncbi:MAG: cytochrome P460 family protein [Candidatus Acidiferrales bacterium]
MRQAMALMLAMVATGGLIAQHAGHLAPAENQPQYTDGNQLVRPQNYREWIYLSSGLGMAYSPNPNIPPTFTNVFVTPSAYRAFVATGRWPDKTMFVLEERTALSKGSINKGGHFQSDFQGIAAAVKDESRFPEKWAYFSFGLDRQSASANPKEACWQCHSHHGAVDNTFVQFYPTLKPIAMKFGTYKPKE